MTLRADQIEIEKIISPGRVYRVDRMKYEAMRDALLAVLLPASRGIVISEAKKRLLPTLSQDLFPGGDTAGWWLKAAQLDLEAKGKIMRDFTRPVRLYRS